MGSCLPFLYGRSCILDKHPYEEKTFYVLVERLHILTGDNHIHLYNQHKTHLFHLVSQLQEPYYRKESLLNQCYINPVHIKEWLIHFFHENRYFQYESCLFRTVFFCIFALRCDQYSVQCESLRKMFQAFGNGKKRPAGNLQYLSRDLDPGPVLLFVECLSILSRIKYKFKE